MFRRQRVLDLRRQNLSGPMVLDVTDDVQGIETVPTDGAETGSGS